MDSTERKPFHLAITMAGAVSAGAYTAGVIDYLFESLDKWSRLKKEAAEFFKNFPDLRDKTWEQIENLYLDDTVFQKARELTPNEEENDNETLEINLRRSAKLYNAVPQHDVLIEILSGASAGGMTAAISSLVLHLPEKNHVSINGKEGDRKKNRLYNSWVNQAEDDMMPLLLGDSDIKMVLKEKPKAKFPVSLLNSQFIRNIAGNALKLSREEREHVGLPDYVAPDFNLFVTMTNLNGYQRTIRLDAVKRNPTDVYPSDFITYDHRDLAMFDFVGDSSEPDAIHINLKEDNDNQILLRNAAVSTGAFPVGLEYGFYDVPTVHIKNNLLLKRMYDDLDDTLTTVNFRSAMVDGGLINNEPFELTEDLLMERLKKRYELKSENDVKALKNYTVLMIDPFPSEKRKSKAKIADNDDESDEHPFDFFGAIFQLVAAVRTQLLVKTKLIKKAFEENDFSCFLIAPKRRVFKKNQDGKLIKKNGRYVPKNETDEHGQEIADSAGNPIPSVYTGSLAIACGCLGGFGGFLHKDFRRHDFRLGQFNSKSFLRNHFRFRTELQDTNPVFKDAYRNEAAEIFKIQDDGKEYFPLVPDVKIIEDILDGKCTKEDIRKRADIEELYGKLKFPRYEMKIFDRLKPLMFVRLNYILLPHIKNMLSKHWYGKPVGLLIPIFTRIVNGMIYNKIRDSVERQLKDWQLIRPLNNGQK